MSLKDFIISKIQSTPAPLQWVYDPCHVAGELADGGSATLAVSGKTYHVLVVRPHEILRFRHSYELLRTSGTPLLVISTDTPLAIADIVETCRSGKKGNVIDCSPKAILESSPPLGTGRTWHELVNDLGDEFLPLLEKLVKLTPHLTFNVNPNTRSDAIRLIIAATMQRDTDTETLEKILASNLDAPDLYALRCNGNKHHQALRYEPCGRNSVRSSPPINGRSLKKLTRRRG
jgi:hypothetical protein